VSDQDLSPEDLDRLAAIMAAAPSSAHPHAPAPGRWSLRSKLILTVLIAGIGAGASVMSCVGQSFSLRQARALESIDAHLATMAASCTNNKVTP
jgi:hypothetical protein